MNAQIHEFLQDDDDGGVCEMVSCNFDHTACDVFRVALWVCKFSHFLEIVWRMWSSSLRAGVNNKPYWDKIMHCFTYTSQLISPCYHPERQLTAFPKSSQLLCCRGSVYFLGLSIWVSATWRVFIAQTYLASQLPYPVISQHAAQTLETSACWYVSLTSELIKCLKLF